jgi:fatty acid desaturase
MAATLSSAGGGGRRMAMAAVFALAFLLVGGAFAVAAALYVGAVRDGRRHLNLFLVPVLLVGIVLAYLIAKVVYEEVLPCATVDARYCDYDSTQYRNLFGWEF